MKNKDNTLLHQGKVPYITFPLLDETGIVKHGFSTRLGGVSSGIYATMNLDFRCAEPKENVLGNYCRITEAMGLSMDDLVLSAQTHSTNIRRMTAEDKGKGFARERDYTDVDGMITNEPGLILTGLFADCVPLFFVDPVHHAIGLSHAGWRGTAGRIAEKTVCAMNREFGTEPKDLTCAVGPSICRDCYEVSADVSDALIAAFSNKNKKSPDENENNLYPDKNKNNLCSDENNTAETETEAITYMGSTSKDVIFPKDNGKYLADLKLANALILKECGVPEEQITVTELCTSCQSELLWSHRATHGNRGEMAAFLSLSI